MGWNDAKGKYPGDGSHQVGFRGENPIGDLVDEPPQAVTYIENGCKTDILRRKIENAYTDIQFTIRIGRTVI